MIISRLRAPIAPFKSIPIFERPVMRGTHAPDQLVDNPVLLGWSERLVTDLRTGRKPPQKPEAIERMRQEREDKALWRMMGHEI